MKALALLFITVLISACGETPSTDNDDSGSSGSDALETQFIDSEVIGLQYRCHSSDRTYPTNQDGVFVCPRGSVVSFHLGNFDFQYGPVSSDEPVITPYDFYPDSPQAAINLGRLLQSLDSDGNPDNGLTIDEDQARNTPADLDIELPDEEFAAAIADSTTINLISEEQAIAHLNETMLAFDAVSTVAPVADAGPDQTVALGQRVTLDGSASFHQDGHNLRYKWIEPSVFRRARIPFGDSTSAITQFMPPAPGTYTFRLIVFAENSGNRVDSDKVTITVPEPDPAVNSLTALTLSDGEFSPAFDPQVHSYTAEIPTDVTHLTLNAIKGFADSNLFINGSIPYSSGTDYEFEVLPGQFSITIVVRPPSYSFGLAGREAVYTVLFTQTENLNTAPVASAGDDQQVAVGDSVQLDGSASSDADGDPLSYRWNLQTRPNASSASLSSSGSSAPTFTADLVGNYVFTLVVNDGQIDSAIDSVTISASLPDNSDPSATDDTVNLLEDQGQVSIDVLANDSFGTDGAATGAITLVSSATLGTLSVNDNGTASDPTDDYFDYRADDDSNGQDSFEYRIEDADGESASAVVTINITAVNDAPSFRVGANQALPLNTTGLQSVTGWVSQFSAGPLNESGQSVSFLVSNDNNALFDGQPAIDGSGNLTFTPADAADGSATVSVRAQDTGGTANGGVNLSPIQTFTISISDTVSLDIEITWPTHNAKIGDKDALPVSLKLTDLDDGEVEAAEVQFVSVNGQFATQDINDASRWFIPNLNVSGELSDLQASVESSSGHSQQSTHSIDHGIGIVTIGSRAFDAQMQRFFIEEHIQDMIFEVDLRNNAQIRTVASRTVGSGTLLQNIHGIAHDPVNDRLLVGDNSLDSVYAVDIATGNRSILISSVNLRAIHDIAIDSVNSRAYVLDDTLHQLHAIDLSDDTRTTISNNTAIGTGPNLVGSSIVADPDNNRILLASTHYDGVMAIDMDNGDRSLFSDVNNGSGPNFSAPGGISLDSANNRALVLDGENLIAVDLDSGDRSIVDEPLFGSYFDAFNNRHLSLEGGLSGKGMSINQLDSATGAVLANIVTKSPKVGTGADFYFPFGSVLDSTNQRLLVADQRNSSADEFPVPLIWSIDLANGDRAIFSGSGLRGSGGDLFNPDALTLDPANNRVLVGGNNEIHAVDLDSGDRSVISNFETGSGPSLSLIRKMALDSDNARLLLTNQAQQILSVDLSNGDRSIVSDSNNSGPALSNFGDLAVDWDNNRAYAASSSNDLLEIDLTSGDHSVISNASTGSGPALSSPVKLALDLDNQRLLVGNLNAGFDTVYAVDLDTGNRSLLYGETGVELPIRQIRSLTLDSAAQRLFVVVDDSVLDFVMVINLDANITTNDAAIFSR